MKITIGITTFNRRELLQLTASSLARSASLDSCRIRVYDDCSDQLTTDEIRNMFPIDVDIIQRERNLGSSENIRRMYVDFLETGDDVLVNCDADLLFRGDWIKIVTTLLPHTDGILSLYNSALHPSMGELRILETPVIEKEHLGSAGTVFSRDIIVEIVRNVPSTRGYDWAWSHFLKNEGKRLLCIKDSYIQHVGLVGVNCGRGIVDYGLGFIPQDDWTTQRNFEFNERLLEAMSRMIDEYKAFIYSHTWSERPKNDIGNG